MALRWAHQRLDRFPAGQLFVDLRGFSPDSALLSAVVVLRGFLDALGVDGAHVPVDPHAQAALFPVWSPVGGCSSCWTTRWIRIR